MFLSIDQNITIAMIEEKLSNNEPLIFKYRLESFSAIFGEAIIFTKYGKIIVSGVRPKLSENIGCWHGIRTFKDVQSGIKIPGSSFPFYSPLSKDGKRYLITKGYADKYVGIKTKTYLPGSRGYKYRGFPKQQRILLLEVNTNKHEINVIKKFRKLPAHWVDWDSFILKNS